MIGVVVGWERRSHTFFSVGKRSHTFFSLVSTVLEDVRSKRLH